MEKTLVCNRCQPTRLFGSCTWCAGQRPTSENSMTIDCNARIDVAPLPNGGAAVNISGEHGGACVHLDALTLDMHIDRLLEIAGRK